MKLAEEVFDRLKVKQSECLLDMHSFMKRSEFTPIEKSLIRTAFSFGAKAGMDLQMYIYESLRKEAEGVRVL